MFVTTTSGHGLFLGLPGRLKHNLSTKGKEALTEALKGRVLHFLLWDLKQLHRIFESQLP